MVLTLPADVRNLAVVPLFPPILFDNHLRLTASFNARRVNEKWGDDGMFGTALGMNPTIPVFPIQTGNLLSAHFPYGYQESCSAKLKVQNTSEGKRTYLLGTIDLKYDDIWHNDNHNVSTTLSYSYNYNDLKSDYYTPSTSRRILLGWLWPAGHQFNIRNGIYEPRGVACQL